MNKSEWRKKMEKVKGDGCLLWALKVECRSSWPSQNSIFNLSALGCQPYLSFQV